MKMVETEIIVSQPDSNCPKSSLIVVSNRLPFVLKKDRKSGKLTRVAR